MFDVKTSYFMVKVLPLVNFLNMIFKGQFTVQMGKMSENRTVWQVSPTIICLVFAILIFKNYVLQQAVNSASTGSSMFNNVAIAQVMTMTGCNACGVPLNR